LFAGLAAFSIMLGTGSFFVMTSEIKRIGVLTGGGDCPGLNAVIRAVTKSAIYHHGLEVVGIEDGFLGLVQNRMHDLKPEHVSNILNLGGTILGSNNRCDPTRYAVEIEGQLDERGKPATEIRDVTASCVEHLKERQIDALIVIGGDGTMSCAGTFVKMGINCIGVPKTIDNDLVGTDVTFGFHTAVGVATDALDRIHTTAASHHRVMVVEVMGRNAGWLALHSGIASGSDVILLPEIPYDLDVICEFVTQRSKHGKRFSLVCCSEGASPRDGQKVVAKVDPTSPDPIRLGGIGEKLADDIAQQADLETRTTVLGHVQRGGNPVAQDRVLSTEYGNAAINLLMAGKRGRLVVMQGRTVSDIDLMDVVNKQRLVPIDHSLIRAARHVGTCFGDEA
jgi:ATP-dependent phosphofructokinase / diphosphate-dependent phosphofructokinase